MSVAKKAGWTLDTLKLLADERERHSAALRAAEDKFQSERDRRYAEVKAEVEKALAIKDKADETARVLARQIQDYKDEKANNLRSQIEGERGQYATKDDLAAASARLEALIRPATSFITAQQGASQQAERDRERRIGNDRLTLAIAGLVLTGVVFGITQLTKTPTPAATSPAPVVTVIVPTPTPTH